MTTAIYQSTILFAEDDELVREVTTETLREAGYRVVAVPDGEAALHALTSLQPDLILSDVRMPRCTGIEFLQSVRSDPAHYYTPFIFMSAKAENSDQRHGMSLGADDYVTKPYRPEDLLQTIKVRLSRAARFNDGIRQQQKFLSRILPHELRTPLNAVLGYAYLMLEIGRAGQSLSAGELVEFGNDIQVSGQRLLEVAEDFSLWSWFETQSQAIRGGKTVVLTPCTISQTKLESWIQATVEQHGRKLDVTLEVQPAGVTVPSEGLVRVIQHLVENTLKFSQPGSPVRIAGVLRGDGYEITFHDHGRSMTDEEIESIGLLRQFQREQHEQQGMGMGLALAYNFARLAGGRFSVSRNQSAPGLTVLMALPVAKTSSAAPELDTSL